MEGNAMDASNVSVVMPEGGDDDGGEEEDEESSSSSPNLEDQLSQFRQEWHAELTSSKPHGRRRRKSSEESSPDEEKARYLFLQGVNAERNGHMFLAIKYYRQALQLVPDIEQKIEDYRTEDDSESGSSSENEFHEDEEALQQLTSQLGILSIADISSVCQKEFPQQATHISALPLEVIHYILRWVVSSDLDLRSLEMVSGVCRGFYVCARDQKLWRLSCVRIWGKSAYLTKEYQTWRHMYLYRPHVLFNGVYICKTTYVRQGENTMNQFYRGWQLVEYYRYIRVFPDGCIMMLTSADDPPSTVARLKSRNCSMMGLMVGHYRIVGNVLTAILEKDRKSEYEFQKLNYTRYRNRNVNQNQEKEVTFHVEFVVSGTGRRHNTRLTWQLYSCHTSYKPENVITVSDFEIQKLDPLVFSRVKSYTRYTQSLL